MCAYMWNFFKVAMYFTNVRVHACACVSALCVFVCVDVRCPRAHLYDRTQTHRDTLVF